MFKAFFILPIIIFFIITAVFITVFVIIAKSIRKGSVFDIAKKNFKTLSEVSKDIFSNNVFSQEETTVCEYCDNILPKGTTKCPNCSARVKIKKKN